MDNKAEDFAEQALQVKVVLKHDDSAVIRCLGSLLLRQSLELSLDNFEFGVVDALLRDDMLPMARELHRVSLVI